MRRANSDSTYSIYRKCVFSEKTRKIETLKSSFGKLILWLLIGIPISLVIALMWWAFTDTEVGYRILFRNVYWWYFVIEMIERILFLFADTSYRFQEWIQD